MKAIARFRLLLFFIILSAFSLTCEYAAAHIPCICNNPPEQCVCFIQLGDKGLAVEKIIAILQKRGYLDKVEKKNEYSIQVKNAVVELQTKHGLDPTGYMDDETLNALLVDELPDKEHRYSEDQWRAIRYVPTDGGQKYHGNPYCSDMNNPRMISRVNAERLGIGPCGKKSCKTYTSLFIEYYQDKPPRFLPDEYYITEEDISSKPMPEQRNHSDTIEDMYIGNKNSHVFHRGTCQYAIDMNEKNKVEFITREEAIEKGYKPCSRCKP